MDVLAARRALHPVAWIKIVGHAPRSYAQLVGLFLLAVIAFGVASLSTAALGYIAIVGDFVVTAMATLMWMAQASLVGGFLRGHAHELGYA